VIQEDMELENPLITVGSEAAGSVLRLAGPLGVGEAESLRLAALDVYARGRNARVDWRAAERIDCSVLQVLLCLRDGLAEKGLALSTTEPTDAVAGYLRTAGVADLFEKAPLE
jgi:anti-anti-sigma regulatory factor